MKVDGVLVRGKEQGHAIVRSGNEAIIVDGDFKDGLLNYGVRYYDDGRYEGGWSSGKRSGKGKFYDKSGDLVYDGQWQDDQWNGSGTNYLNGSYVDDTGHGIHITGQWLNGQPLEGTIQYTSYGSAIKIWKNGKFNDIQAASEGTDVTSDVSNSEVSEDSNSSAGLQVLSAALSTAIQVRGMKDAAAQQRAYQAAVNQQARANAVALAQAQSAAVQAQQAQAQAQHDAQRAQEQAAAAQAQAAAQADANVAVSHPKPAYAPASAPASNPGYARAPASAPSGPPSFTTSDQQHCDNSDDPLSCTYNVLVSNHGNRGINCTADITLYRINSVTGDVDQLGARDVGYVPANSTSTVSSNLAKGGNYNVNCSY